MKALVFESGLHLLDVNLKVAADDSVIRIKRAGICGTDIAIAKGDYKIREPLILGHELFGVVEEVKHRSDLRREDRVVSEINVSCGTCYFCRRNMNTHCKNIQTLGISRDGGFAERLSVPARNLHKVPDSISDEEAAFIEPLAAAVQLTKMASVREGESILIVGSGRLALLILQVLKLARPSLIAVLGKRRSKLEIAKQLGADAVFTSEESEKCVQLVDGNGFDHVVEATGNEDGLAMAVDLVRPRGTIHVKSTHGLKARFDITKAVVKEVRIQGSRCGPFDDAIKLLAEGSVDIRRLLTSTYSLEDFEQAFREASGGEAIKVQFVL
ncbi:MAG: alcohol dehydrogenase catalytic domain-containing protein [Conexivisphaerales archaeon]